MAVLTTHRLRDHGTHPAKAASPDSRSNQPRIEPGAGAALGGLGTGDGLAGPETGAALDPPDGGTGAGDGRGVTDGGTGAGDGRGVADGGTGAGTALGPPDGETGAADATGVPDGGTGAGVRPDGAAEGWAAVSASRVAAGWLAADATARPAPPATRAATGTPSQVIVRLRKVLMLGQPPIQPAAMAGGRGKYQRGGPAVAYHQEKARASPAGAGRGGTAPGRGPGRPGRRACPVSGLRGAPLRVAGAEVARPGG
jgi:hypothetical protein